MIEFESQELQPWTAVCRPNKVPTAVQGCNSIGFQFGLYYVAGTVTLCTWYQPCIILCPNIISHVRILSIVMEPA